MDVRQRMFRLRSYTPIPFLVVMIAFAAPTPISLVAGFIIIVFGETIRLWGVAIAGSETRTTGTVGGTFLITTGPFSYVRNPLYVGNMVLYVGCGVMSFALFPWLPLAAFAYFFMQYSLIVSLEEAHLRGKFGEEYRRYCGAVPRFLPALRPYRGGAHEQPELEWKRGLQSEKRTFQAVALITALLVALWLWR